MSNEEKMERIEPIDMADRFIQMGDLRLESVNTINTLMAEMVCKFNEILDRKQKVEEKKEVKK
jgi:hypothetical protein